MDDVWTVIISAAVGAVASLLAAMLQGRSDIDRDLRLQRETEYAKLLGLMTVVPKWPPNRDLHYADLLQLQRELRAWYFTWGGLIMSRPTQRAYAGVQEGLDARRVSEAAPEGDPVQGHQIIPPKEPIRLCATQRASHALRRTGRALRGCPQPKAPADDYEAVQRLLSTLRTQMTKDLLSRTRPAVFRR